MFLNIRRGAMSIPRAANMFILTNQILLCFINTVHDYNSLSVCKAETTFEWSCLNLKSYNFFISQIKFLPNQYFFCIFSNEIRKSFCSCINLKKWMRKPNDKTVLRTTDLNSAKSCSLITYRISF